MPDVSTTGLVLPGGGARRLPGRRPEGHRGDRAGTARTLFPSSWARPLAPSMPSRWQLTRPSSRLGVERIVDFWATLATSDVYRTDLCDHHEGRRPLGRFSHADQLFRPSSHPRSLLNNAPLGDLLRRRIDLGRLDEAIASGALRAIGVTASSYERARAITFFQGVEGLEEWVRVRRDGVAVKLEIEHLLASAALAVRLRGAAHRRTNTMATGRCV